MPRRTALTLLELVVTLASSIVLVAGLAGSVYISSQALTGTVNSRQSLAASTVLRDLMADVSQANTFTERTARAITFTVPDRDGDLAPEVIRYAWSGTPGDPLTYQFNGSAAVNIATDVRAFNLSALTRELAVASVSAPEAENVVYEGMTSAKKTTAGSGNLSIAAPQNTSGGDLLIACIVADGNAALSDPSAWTRRYIGFGRTGGGTPQVTLGVWWTIATNSQGNTSWSVNRPAYGWIMRFTGHHSSPIHASAIAEGTSTSAAPPCPPVTTTVENTMIVRLGGFDANNITVASPGLNLPSAHSAITMDYSSNTSTGCSGGAGHLLQATAGSSNTSNFALTAAQEYVTVTIAIAPLATE